MALQIGAKDARAKFAELLGRVGFGHEEIVIERSGKPMAVLIPIEVYDLLVAEREVRFEIVDRMQKRQPDFAVEQVEKDVDDILKNVRARRASNRD